MLDWLRMRIWILPVWMWILIITGGAALFLWWRKRNGGVTGSDPTSSGLAPQLQDPPFMSDPQYSGGRQEPGWTGPNSDVPPWMQLPDLGSPGSSFDPVLSDTWTPFPTVSVPQLPSFDPIPPLTPAGKQPGPKDTRMTTAQVEIARERVAEKLFPGDSTVNQFVQQATSPTPAQTSAQQNVANQVFSSPPATKTPTKTTQTLVQKFQANKKPFFK